MDPQKGEKRVRKFKGLDKVPVISAEEKGNTYTLMADDIGSIDIGSPIYYKKLRAGSVASYALDPAGKSVSIKVFIRAPFNKLVTDRTRFWNASGISASIGTDGVEIRTESLTSILAGGLAFDDLNQLGEGKRVERNHQFRLYRSFKKAKKIHYKRELYFWVYFEHTIRGLSIGAPVEFRGVKIGEVVNFSLVGNADSAVFRIPILIKIEPERFSIAGKKTGSNGGVDFAILEKLVKKGFRAQLQSGNLLTGELFVDLDFHKDAPDIALRKEKGYYVIPTVPATMESLKSDIKTVLERVSSIPFEKIGNEIELAMKDIRTKTLPKINQSVESTDRLIRDTDKTMNAARKNYIDSNAQINKKLIKLLDEMTRTSRSIKNLTDYLERHPESLIKGK
jgi:paraquat-inducible protein B